MKCNATGRYDGIERGQILENLSLGVITQKKLAIRKREKSILGDSRVIFARKVEMGNKFGKVMTPDPARFYADTFTEMSVSAKRQDKRRSHRPSDRYRVNSGVPGTERKMVGTTAGQMSRDV